MWAMNPLPFKRIGEGIVRVTLAEGYNAAIRTYNAAEQKSLTIFISTHSVTMIKSADKNHIISIEETENGKYDAVCPCYPAKAIGNVDFIDNVIYDAVFFVEDDMARTLLKRMIQTCCDGCSA